jgi:hypothetical protein
MMGMPCKQRLKAVLVLLAALKRFLDAGSAK